MEKKAWEPSLPRNRIRVWVTSLSSMKKGLGRLVSLEMEKEFGRLISLELENMFRRLVSVAIEKRFRRLVSKSFQDSICTRASAL